MDADERRRSILELFTLPPIPEQGRDRLVGVAMALFYFHGITPIGLDRILAEAGVSKTTFYKHFETKDDLLIAVQRTAGDRRSVYGAPHAAMPPSTWTRRTSAPTGIDTDCGIDRFESQSSRRPPLRTIALRPLAARSGSTRANGTPFTSTSP